MEDPFEALRRDPDIAAAAERARAEERAEAAEYEALAALDLARSRTLADVLRGHCDRGDTVEVVLPTGALVGVVVEAAGDLARLVVAGAPVDVRVDAVLAVRPVVLARRGGSTTRGAVRSFRARLAELEAERAEVEVLTVGPLGSVAGRLAVVARDHLVLEGVDGAPRHVAIAAVAAVRRRP